MFPLFVLLGWGAESKLPLNMFDIMEEMGDQKASKCTSAGLTGTIGSTDNIRP